MFLFFQNTLQLDPHDRFSIDECLDHPAFQTEQLLSRKKLAHHRNRDPVILHNEANNNHQSQRKTSDDHGDEGKSRVNGNVGDVTNGGGGNHNNRNISRIVITQTSHHQSHIRNKLT